MIDSPLFLPVALGLLGLLQLLVLVLLLRLSARVARLSRRSAAPEPSKREAEESKESGSEQTKWFSAFLAEEPARRELPKKEQFAEFRRWRDEKGLNWKGPGASGG